MSEEITEIAKDKKAAKAELKATKKAKKAAKEAGKSVEKAKRKAEKLAFKAEPAVSKAAPELKQETTAKTLKSGKVKSASPAEKSVSLGAKLQAVARLARGNLASDLLKHGLYAGQELVLFALDEHGPLSLAELADMLDVRAPTITKTVTRMEAQGFLSRAVSRDDARSIIIALSPDGRRVLKICREIVQDVESKTFSILSAADCDSLQKHLDSVFSQIKHRE